MSGWGPEMAQLVLCPPGSDIALKRDAMEGLCNTKVLHTLFLWIFKSCGILSHP